MTVEEERRKERGVEERDMWGHVGMGGKEGDG